jgi:hypothetical protein
MVIGAGVVFCTIVGVFERENAGFVSCDASHGHTFIHSYIHTSELSTSVSVAKGFIFKIEIENISNNIVIESTFSFDNECTK